MRAVATELGMGTMSVYRYVADRAQLEALVVDHVLTGVDTSVPDVRARHRQIAELADRVRTAVGTHPAVVPLILAHRHTSPASMRWGNTVLGILADAGLGPAERVMAFRALVAYVFGALQVEHFSPLAGTGTTALATLDPADHPHLASTAREAQGIGPEREFRGGLDLLLRGLDL